jgi:RNA polymerase-binding transcription factor DksA
MDKKQKAELERALVAERTRLAKRLAQFDARTGASPQDRAGDLSLFPLHPADEGTDAMEMELDSSLAMRAGELLAEVDDALRALYSGAQYGICQACGKAIPHARLQLIPWARHCASCTVGVEAGGA